MDIMGGSLVVYKTWFHVSFLGVLSIDGLNASNLHECNNKVELFVFHSTSSQILGGRELKLNL